MVIPSGYRQCKTCNKQFKKWSTKDTANYCPSCNSSRLTRHEVKVRLNWHDGSKERDEKLKKIQERRSAANKRYWEEQEKRKDPDYISKKKDRNQRKKSNYHLNKKPVSFDDIIKRKRKGIK